MLDTGQGQHDAQATTATRPAGSQYQPTLPSNYPNIHPTIQAQLRRLRPPSLRPTPIHVSVPARSDSLHNRSVPHLQDPRARPPTPEQPLPGKSLPGKRNRRARYHTWCERCRAAVPGAQRSRRRVRSVFRRLHVGGVGFSPPPRRRCILILATLC